MYTSSHVDDITRATASETDAERFYRWSSGVEESVSDHYLSRSVRESCWEESGEQAAKGPKHLFEATSKVVIGHREVRAVSDTESSPPWAGLPPCSITVLDEDNDVQQNEISGDNNPKCTERLEEEHIEELDLKEVDENQEMVDEQVLLFQKTIIIPDVDARSVETSVDIMAEQEQEEGRGVEIESEHKQEEDRGVEIGGENSWDEHFGMEGVFPNGPRGLH
ncbi:hypothetical protein CEUSTIGMA_g13556.t1 [Chlamydomonas eustigma]|uniref:Uncharacterized protein n=1 Tax=Chlamydomonas eustigma TaxID=1157962 RepID=A0A250XT03_9CHLO|nr:hypothetical protein CEUSTIGMA_g13556.t1 [Chlamydomonas eustigma]|eukprot:GAX86143.1 hypothetical protein CEUSTIGMA_g13556.t1 [Chlamydomonas eustigma]